MINTFQNENIKIKNVIWSDNNLNVAIICKQGFKFKESYHNI